MTSSGRSKGSPGPGAGDARAVGENWIRLLSVNDILELDSRECYHFAVGYSKGSPWRFDSVYLRQEAFDLVDPPIRGLTRFVAQGVTVVQAQEMSDLLARFDAFECRLNAAGEPSEVYGDRAVFKPALDAWDTWTEAKPHIALVTAQLVEWMHAQTLEGLGITIYSPGR